MCSIRATNKYFKYLSDDCKLITLKITILKKSKKKIFVNKLKIKNAGNHMLDLIRELVIRLCNTSARQT